MKSILKAFVALTLLLSFTACNTQIKNAKTETVKIYGNCGMCEKTIEKAGNIKDVATVDWDKDSKMATLTYDAEKTNQAEILKRIALSGYDSDSFLAPDDVYATLPNCCQYDREKKVATKVEEPPIKTDTIDHSAHKVQVEKQVEKQEVNQLTAVFDNYFAVKDALVQTNGGRTSEKAKALLAAINAVKMDKLEKNVHVVWMKVLADLKKDAEYIANSKDAALQRNYFINLSNNMYALMKVSKYEQPVYYQFCPMANDGKGANWLSKENAVKNPYYGSEMLTCGKTVETIK
jgi:copper chaperone CopZ